MYVADSVAHWSARPAAVQIYGQGESPMTITAAVGREHTDGHDGRRSSGSDLSDGHRWASEVAVLDEHDRPVGAGAIGEACSAPATRDGWLVITAAHRGDDARRAGCTPATSATSMPCYLTLVDRSKDLIISGGSKFIRARSRGAADAPAIKEAQ